MEYFQKHMKIFWGSRKSQNYKDIVENLLSPFEKMGYNMLLKLHFLYSHLNFSPEISMGEISDEHGEKSTRI